MIDKELVSMCDCPEIQDRWQPKVGDRYMHYSQRGMAHPIIGIIMPHGENKFPKLDMTHIPRIEDVLEWLVPKHYDTWNDMCGALGVQLGNTMLKGMLELLYFCEYDKEWNGEAWV